MPKRFSASTAAMQMACHASGNLELAIPNWEQPKEDRTADNAANEGTSVHEILAKFSELRASDMLHAARALMYVAELRKTRRFNVLIEEEVKAEWLDSAPTSTADLVLYTQDEMHVIDWKWGRIPVEVVRNHQLMYYAACYAPLAPRAKGVTLHIVQPRADNIDSWFVDTTELGQFMAEAQAAERAIAGGSVTFGPSDHCMFCPANPHTRSAEKGTPLCPEMLQILYPRVLDEDAILDL